MNFRKTDQRIEEMIETERDYVKSLNYIIKVKISLFLTSKMTRKKSQKWPKMTKYWNRLAQKWPELTQNDPKVTQK